MLVARTLNNFFMDMKFVSSIKIEIALADKANRDEVALLIDALHRHRDISITSFRRDARAIYAEAVPTSLILAYELLQKLRFSDFRSIFKRIAIETNASGILVLPVHSKTPIAGERPMAIAH